MLFELVWRSYQPDAYLLGISPLFNVFFSPQQPSHQGIGEWGEVGNVAKFPVTMVLTWLNCTLLEIPRPWELPDLKSGCSPTLLNALPASCTSTESVRIWKDTNTWGGFRWNVAFFFFWTKHTKKTPAAIKIPKDMLRIRTSLLLSQRKQTSE